jgi:seryl-tRNA synthetase
MGLDIQIFRSNPALVKESQRRRFQPEAEVDTIIELDSKLKKSM